MRASVLMLGGRALTSTVLVKELDREEVQQCAECEVDSLWSPLSGVFVSFLFL